MMEVPSSEWRSGTLDRAAAEKAAPVSRALVGAAGRGASQLHAFRSRAHGADRQNARDESAKASGCSPTALDTQALPTVMKKVIAFALGGFPREV